MSLAARVTGGRWVDSAKLMAAARVAEAVAGVDRASCFMGTPANLAAARELGLFDAAMADAGPDDLVIVVDGPDAPAGLAAAAAALDAPPRSDAGGGAGGWLAAGPPRTLDAASAGVAVVSVPGEYAALEAHKALGAGMDVLLFSDGVPMEEELALKARARRLGLLVMGPGAGTAIIDGIGLGFANVVARGPVGVVAAAGTGAQEVTVLLDRCGTGVSRCYGTGGRDVKDEIGAITMLDAIARLDADPATAAILCVSKPPSPAVAARVLEALAATETPAAACFVGAGSLSAPAGVELCATLEEAAFAAARLVGVEPPPIAVPAVDWLAGGRICGLFSGGTLCAEAAAILAERLPGVVSNAAAGRARPLPSGPAPGGHVLIDMGEEEFTRGRPHPMIDPLARAERLAEEAADPTVGVLLLDVVLGYASHPDPAGALAPAIAGALAAHPSRAVVAYVCGTEADPQVRSRQEATLGALGVRLARTNAEAARLAAALVA